MLAIPDMCPSFEVLAGQPHDRQGPWHAALARAFELGRTLHARMLAELRAGRLVAPTFLRGRLGPEARDVQEDFQCDYPLELQSPFEGVDTVAGAVWMGSELFAELCEDAIIKLRFEAGTNELPLHTHERSDRVIVVLRGRGEFHFANQSLVAFKGDRVTSTVVEPGMVLAFTRGLLHTFSSPREPLYLLSYHAPFIPLDDGDQFTLPEVRWIPGVERNHA